ncbi:hypothetical protein HYH02_013860 [Chlamydomonas schloesseri]|uniref:Uncharacterized protein n=1 Tax=Chlamydomonas schloesseri TaxID=2026947 RepID=A0A835VY00_9CHLO|nr:hypothetical protein HYH02_013860 [Chlamydomonas schloesseri]|eukprot:KAG2430033.1 hypothetical protein HYH02_013860 [Chlamydomonas schloesseri]
MQGGPQRALELSQLSPQHGEAGPSGEPNAAQPSSSNLTQENGGPAAPVLDQLGSPKLAPCKSILKTSLPDSIRNDTTNYKRNISWQDQYGQSLTQVVEFEPSEHADSEYDDLEGERGCCVVM